MFSEAEAGRICSSLPNEQSPLTCNSAEDESSHIEMIFVSKRPSDNDDRGIECMEICKENEQLDDEVLRDKDGTTVGKHCKRCHVPTCLKPCLPPRGLFAYYLTRGLICFIAWATMWAVLGDEALPGQNLFSLFILLVFASLAGFFVSKIPFVTFPPLLGMLIAGFLLRNVPGISVAKSINKQWSAHLRNVALVVILLRSGLGLDIKALKRLKCTVLRLAFCPCLVEALTVGIISHFLLGMPWLWALMLGYVWLFFTLLHVLSMLKAKPQGRIHVKLTPDIRQ